jgi:hypothetical protein
LALLDLCLFQLSPQLLHQILRKRLLSLKSSALERYTRRSNRAVRIEESAK